MSFRPLLKKTVASAATLISLVSCAPVSAQTLQPVTWADISGFKLELTSLPLPEGLTDLNAAFCSGVGVPSGRIAERGLGSDAMFDQPAWDRKVISTAHGSLSLELPSPRRAGSQEHEVGYAWSDGRPVQHYSIVSNTQFRFGRLLQFSMNGQNGLACGVNREYRLDVEKRSLKDVLKLFNENAEARIRERRITRGNTLKPILFMIGNKNAMVLPVYDEDLDMYTYGQISVEWKKGMVAHFTKESGAAYPRAEKRSAELDFTLLRIAESVR